MANTWKWTPDSKLCFVTTGATAPFTALIESVMKSSTLNTLQSHGFTHLLVQYGSAKDLFGTVSQTALAHIKGNEKFKNFVIDGMDFNSEGLAAQFRLVQESKGLVISHAGILSLQG